MSAIQKIVIRVLIFILLFLAINFVYVHTWYKKDLEKFCWIMPNIQDLPADTRILYLAESSNFRYSDSDSNKRRISQLASDYFPGLKFSHLDQGALHAGNYKWILRNVSKKSDIQTVIVTMNLRSFGADWIYSNLETSLQQQMVMLRRNLPLVNRAVISFRGYDIKNDEERHQQLIDKWTRDKLVFPWEFPYSNVMEWDSAVGNGSFRNPDGSWDMPRIELATNFIKNFAFQIDTLTNPRIKDFDDIVKYCSKRNWNVVFLIMAENTDKASELTDKDLVWLMLQNRNLLLKRYTAKGVLVVDNLESVPDSCFIDRDWPTEHYNEAGRRIIAHNLADSLKKFHGDKYVQYPPALQAK